MKEGIQITDEVFIRLIDYIEHENYKGYDPYDYLNSWIPFRWFGKMVQAIVVQAGKLIPLNLRPILGIKKDEIPKGLGIMLRAYSILYRKSCNANYLEKAHCLFERLMVLRSQSKYACWGYNFVWANPDIVHPKYMPSSVVTSFVAQGIYEYYLITKAPKAKEVLISASDYIRNSIICTEIDGEICYSYTEEGASCCYNASLLAAELLAIHYKLTDDPQLKPMIISALRYVLSKQYEDGHWGYSIDINTGRERMQTDFHQGFILCSLEHIKTLLELKDPMLEDSIRKGLSYYKSQQFFDNGQSLWRLPKVYPVEIHNQAQGIITFCELSKYELEYHEFSKKICSWTINNMRHNSGYFYYRKFKYYTNKISYMRWSNAWMFLAFSLLLTSNNKSEESK